MTPARSRLRRAAPTLLLAAVAYVPLLLTRPGRVGADTKTYLYLDPGRLLGRAASLWDPNIGLGTVSHQTIGYLFPMGPFYWLLDTLGLPDWVAQRLWLGTVLFAAGAGVLFLLRTLRWEGGGVLVAALAYQLSPYVLHYASRISVILLPWAALPWLIALTIRSVRQGGWRWPALFALVVLCVGSVNATALLLAGIGPLLWLVFAVWVDREVSLGRALAAAARIGVLTVGVSLWWIAGLLLQGSYGIPILRYTETYEVVADAALAPELLRGLGYWFFYGNDKLGPWIQPSAAYTERLALLAVSYLLPLLAFAAAVLTRWRHRPFFVALVVVGTFVAVGAHPYGDPSPLGALFNAFTQLDAGLAFRSTPRAVPLLALGTSVLLGAGVAAVGRRLPRAGTVAGVGVCLLVAVNLPPLWLGQVVDRNLDRPEELPAHWPEAAAWLDARGDGTRVWELPGSDFASYRWGNTVDPVTPGLMDRPYVARELIPWGSPASADLLNAIDRRMQEGVFEPASLAPIARIMGVGDVVLRNDLQFERYRTPRPDLLWQQLRGAPGFEEPVGFGDPVANTPVPALPLVDEIALGAPADLPHSSPVAALPVTDPRPIVRTTSAERPLVLAGDGEGLVEAAAAGLLDPDQVVLYAASMAGRPDQIQQALDDGADLLVTDSNRARGRRWGTVRENTGYTERPGEAPLRDDPSDNRLDLFPGAGDDDATVALQRGGATVSATAYGNPVTFTAGDRAIGALDGDVTTAWKVGAFDDVTGERLQIVLDQPVTTDRVALLQALGPLQNRWITEVRLRFDGGDPVSAALGPESRGEPGQVVTFPPRTFTTLDIEIRETDIGRRPRYDGVSGVGFAEVGIGDLRLTEVVRPPTSLLDAAGASSIGHRLTYLLARQRSDPREPVRDDEERSLIRLLELPVGRSFHLTGTARLSALVPDEDVDALLGVPGADAGGVTASSSGRLPGDLGARAASALDADPATAWMPALGPQEGGWIEVELPSPITLDGLDLSLLADGRHSVPTRLGLEVDGRPAGTVELPPVTDGEPGSVTEVPVTFPAVSGSTLRFTVDAVRPVTSIDWYSGLPVTLPVGIVELGLDGVRMPALPAELPGTCRDDLLTIDGEPVPVRITGTTADAVARDGLAATTCDPDGGPVRLDAGSHLLRTAQGRDTGIGVDIDRLVLASEAGGRPAVSPAPPVPAGPTVELVDEGRTATTVRVTGADDPYWLVLGQSFNAGWQATVDGGGSLGDPRLVDGFANGWRVDPATVGADAVIHLRWAPQGIVRFGLAGSAVAVGACIVLLVVGGRRRRPVDEQPPERPEPVDPLDAGGAPPPTRTVAVAGVTAGLLAALLIGPLAGVLVAGGAVAALTTRWGRVAVRVAAVGALALAALYVLVQQYRHQYPADFIWPKNFERTHLLGLLAVAFLAVDAMAGRLRLAPAGAER
ncbi:MAG: DUF3367 domain-containing protein [Acidimicrobiales bacterium]|nr:DUF3367 domain-containing protein [Acidimicrobiales bacterium]